MNRLERVRLGLLVGVAPVMVMGPLMVLGLGDRAAAAERATPLANPLQAQSIAKLWATHARPLFDPSRREPPRQPPAPPPVVTASVPPPAPPAVTLVAILKSETLARALLRSGSNGKLVTVKVGDLVGGWKVAAIEDRQINLALGSRQESFSLFKSFVAHSAKKIEPASYQMPQPAPLQGPPPPDAQGEKSGVAPAPQLLIRPRPRDQAMRW